MGRGEGDNEPPQALSRLLGPLAFAPFRVRAFRLQWPADLLTACAFEMETLILGWYVLVETGSVLLLTLFGALQYRRHLVAPMFGVVGDRIGHRNLLCGMRAAYATLATTLMTVAFAGVLTPMLVFIIAGLTGIVRPSDLGVRIALIADNIAGRPLVAAMGISRTTSDCARIAGALAGAGLFAAFGMGPAYVVVTSFYALGLLLTLAIGAARPKPHRRPTRAGRVAPVGLARSQEGLAYVWSNAAAARGDDGRLPGQPDGVSAIERLLPYVAKEIYRIDQTGLGYLRRQLRLRRAAGLGSGEHARRHQARRA